MTRISDPREQLRRSDTASSQPTSPNDAPVAAAPRGERQPTVSHRVQYGALRGVIGLLRRIGMRPAGALGANLGMLGYRPLAIRREVVERQVRAAFPELPPEEVQRIARASYANLGRTTAETALLSLYDRERIIDMFEDVEGWSIVEERLARGKGLILVSEIGRASCRERV